MLRVLCSGPVAIALAAIAAGCGGLVEPEDVVTGPVPETSASGAPKTPKSGTLPTPSKTGTAGRVDWTFAGTGSASIPGMGAIPVCLVVGGEGQVWAAGRRADIEDDTPRELVQLDPRGSLDERIAPVPFEQRRGFLAKLVGLEGCARTEDGALVVVHRGGKLGDVEVPVGPGLAYASRLVATTPQVTFETVALPFAALLVEVMNDGSYVVAADKTDGIAELAIARVTRGGLVLPSIATPAVRHFRVRRLARDGDSVVLGGVVDGASAYPNVMVGRLDAGAIAWTYPGLADLDTSLGPRDRFGLAVSADGQVHLATGPDLTITRFTKRSAPLALDADYGSGGRVRHDDFGFAWDATAVAGGRLVVATSTGLVRITSDGEIDPHYGDAGVAEVVSATNRPLRVSSTTDGAVLVAGVSATNTLEITRYTP